MSDRVQEAYVEACALYDRFLLGEGLSDGFRRKLHAALEVIDAALRLYGPSGVAIAFNGGKDATVILHLFRAALAQSVREREHQNEDRHSASQNGSTLTAAATARVRSMYIVDDDEFDEVRRFVDELCRECAIESSCLYKSFKDSVDEFLTEQSKVKAFVLGTRYDDPDGRNLEHFSPSSKGWPSFMRVNPILEWDFADVWQFLRHFGLRYCSLYDEGYTSLGRASKTRPNPRLKTAEGGFLPAYQLTDKSMERAGRISQATLNNMENVYRSAGIVVISSEALERELPNFNHSDASMLLKGQGVELGKLSIIPAKNLTLASAEIADQSKQFDVVITVGDAVLTMQAVATALHLTLTHSPELQKFLEASGVCCESSKGTAEVPEGTECLEWSTDRTTEVSGASKGMADYPIFKTRNVFSLPDISVPLHLGVRTVAHHL